jgi:hypothetical protein
MPHGSSHLDTNTSILARKASADARQVATELDLTKAHLERLMMICEALWTIIKKQHDLEDKDLMDYVAQVDMQDGKLDGKVAKQAPPKCQECGRTSSRQSMICIFCGTLVERGPFDR